MKRSTLNFIINAILFVFISALTGTGLLLKYSLISGQESQVVYGGKVDLFLWGMDRHEWGYIHLILAYVLLGLVILHIVLHWKIVVAVYYRVCHGNRIVRVVTLLIVAICALFIIAPFFIKPKVVESGRGGRNRTGGDGLQMSMEHFEMSGLHFHSFML